MAYLGFLCQKVRRDDLAKTPTSQKGNGDLVRIQSPGGQGGAKRSSYPPVAT